MQRALDDFAILFITIPIYVPIVRDLGFDITCFAMLFILSMRSAYLRLPFGYNLFYMRSLAQKSITIVEYLLLGAALHWFSACWLCTGCRFFGHCAVAIPFVVLTNASPVLQADTY
ncbi:hypothetical protein ABA45_01510 [Marinobacter psychrophilus]|uniref:TRAP C4-dicarboxylate transport system permease DctM subunit domain-containing protein n=1 Tax=Marinobacter psychrophilus TaxID=330734 RepID=A0A0H4HX36_9GAMM|nr:TRAP transporter large permease subunit [Marinobacter psychrophilus]AKO51264.1 hypothetical protein ABA45_01510 [Marinobacter psychrophilus]